MSNEVKYRHPFNHELDWSGRGKAPKWYTHALENGFTEDALRVENQPVSASVEPDIDLGINSAIPQSIVIDAQDERLDISLAGTSEAGLLQLQVCLQEFGMQALTAQEFIQAGIDYINQATIYACRAGVAFWAAQEALKSENESTPPERSRSFKEWISEAGLTEQRVYEAIAIAKFYSRLPEAMRSKALTISKKNALLLASLPQEVIDQAAESGNNLIEKADCMTVAQLRDEIKALQRREKNFEAELERAGNQIKRLSEAKKRTSDFLLRTEEIREECMALQLGAELHLNSLRKLFEDTDQQAPEGGLQIEHLWVVANTLAARVSDLLEFMEARVPDGMPNRPKSQHMLTTEEAQRWLLDYPLIENRFAAEQAAREAKRDAQRPKGPGRPAGSKNKGSEE
jgi:hypothetical protein